MVEIILHDKIREPWIRDGFSYFEKRLRNVTVTLVKTIPERPKLILLSEEGKKMTSREFASFIEPDMSFCIGPTDGFSDDQKKDAVCISLSDMTLTHEMAALFLIEQLYRAKMIQENRPYHRD